MMFDFVNCHSNSKRMQEIQRNAESLHQKQEESETGRSSISTLNSNLENLNQRKSDIVNDLQLRGKIDNNGSVQNLFPLLKSLKALELRESGLKSDCEARRHELEARFCELEEKVEADVDSDRLADDLDCVTSKALDELDLAKKELAATLRKVLSVKRQLDDLPIQSELVQYERRLSELNAHIQEKHRQTRKYYATYNALLEIKELMLKETSLLNSISSQFQNAISNSDGRVKLINSMEEIIRGGKQKLQKVETQFQEEQKTCDALKKQYSSAIAEQRRCYSLLKAFQEECAKNERLRSHISS